MQDQKNRIRALFYKCLTHVESHSERKEWIEISKDPANHRFISKLIDEAFLDPTFETVMDDGSKKKILENVFDDEEDFTSNQIKTNKLLRRRKLRYIPISVAASLFLFLALGVYFLKNKDSWSISDSMISDVEPGQYKATLILENGKTIDLSDSRQLNNSNVDEAQLSIDNEGTLVYSDLGAKEGKINTIKTSNGESYRLVLPDGTKVWLNAGTTLRFSTDLKRQDVRTVFLDGEAYFEVNKQNLTSNKRSGNIPFEVISSNQVLEVKGTKFNVRDYDKEKSAISTLLEGVVEVRAGDHIEVIRPGYEAVLLPGQGFVMSESNLLESLAWKEGYFYFENTSLAEVLNQLVKWYDVKIQNQIPHSEETYSGMISRDKTLRVVLNTLEHIGDLKFQIKNKTIIIHK